MLATTPAFKEVTAGQILVTLAQTAKPTIPAYPGVQADILGIHIGMTVAQAEAIAAKTYPAPPDETRSLLSINQAGISAQSQSFITDVAFRNGADDDLMLNFTNPAAGNVVYRIYRDVLFTDVSKRPLITDLTSGFIKKYGPTSSQDNGRYRWQFGKQSPESCPHDGCMDSLTPSLDPFIGALKSGVLMQISANVWPYIDMTEVSRLELGMEDYQLKNESVNAGNQQLVSAVRAAQAASANHVVSANAEPPEQVAPEQTHTTLTGTYVPIAYTNPAVLKLKANADNVLDITGLVTGHALVVNCTNDSSGYGIMAHTISAADSKVASAIDIPMAVTEKYGTDLVTYNGQKYSIGIQAFGKPPLATKADLTLYTMVGLGDTTFGEKLVNGSIAIAVAGNFVEFTFDHAVIKFDSIYADGPKVPSDATVTINGKAFCDGSGNAQPLPQSLMDNVPDRSLEFVSNGVVDVHTRDGIQRETYKINDFHQVLINGAALNDYFKIDSDGCIEQHGNGDKFCRQ